MRSCVSGIRIWLGRCPSGLQIIVSFGRSWTIYHALVEAKVSEYLKVKDAIFWPLRLIIKFIARPSCVTVKKKMV